MRFIEKIIQKQISNSDNPAAAIAFLGDSVTQGCFELYEKSDGVITDVFDKESAYHNYMAKIFSLLYPSVPINIINAGISGGSAPHGYERLERDVLAYNPDLVVVCFGLNDTGLGMAGLDQYADALEKIFLKLQKADIDIIFMTPNMMATEISCHIRNNKKMADIAKEISNRQNAGLLDVYVDKAIQVCKKNNVTVCDCYKKWKAMYKCGVNVTELFANKLNHPTREMNWLFAVSLVETIMNMG